MADTDSWCSPPEIADPVEEFFDGPVDVDPCSNDRSLVLPWRLPRTQAKGTVYENDPYSKAGIWTDKMLRELACDNVTEIIRLSIMATSSVWWQRMCLEPKRRPRVLGLRRISFLDPFAEAAGKRREVCRFEPALTYIGPRVKRFDKVFAHLTRWSTWGR
jgi:hypothetical protein